jgi:hypothetical protein
LPESAGLQGKVFEWQDYGGPIALHLLSEFVRKKFFPVT